jgi:mycothione reductase
MAALSYDLVIVGADSGNMLPADEFAGWRIAIVDAGRFGGTCLNRGCIPSKMLVYTADIADRPARGPVRDPCFLERG